MTDTDRIVEIIARARDRTAFGDEKENSYFGSVHAQNRRREAYGEALNIVAALSAAGLPVDRLADVMDGKAVIVPAEPTEAMIWEACEVYRKNGGFRKVYRAMIRAAAKEDQTDG